MANICENQIRVCSTDSNNIDFIISFLEENFKGNDIVEINDNEIEGYFDSKWTFPEDLMEEMYDKLPNKDDIGITVLSIEWGCFYCEFHTCDSEGWKLE